MGAGVMEAAAAQQGDEADKAKRIGASQLIPGVRWTSLLRRSATPERRLTRAGYGVGWRNMAMQASRNGFAHGGEPTARADRIELRKSATDSGHGTAEGHHGIAPRRCYNEG